MSHRTHFFNYLRTFKMLTNETEQLKNKLLHRFFILGVGESSLEQHEASFSDLSTLASSSTTSLRLSIIL